MHTYSTALKPEYSTSHKDGKLLLVEVAHLTVNNMINSLTVLWHVYYNHAYKSENLTIASASKQLIRAVQ